MNELKAFRYAGQSVRTINEDGEPKFLLKDLCEILEVGHVATVKRRLEDDVVSNHPIEDSLGRMQTATFVNESGMYDVILDSRKPEAREFRRWITNEVIPSIRKHGGYLTPNKVEEALLNPDTIIQLATNLKEEQEKRAAYEKQIAEDQPYTNYGKQVSISDSSINVGSFCKLIYDKHGISIGRNKMFAWLRDSGFLITSGREKNDPKQKYLEQGLFETTPTIVSRTAGDVQRNTTFITGKGQVKIMEMLLQELQPS